MIGQVALTRPASGVAGGVVAAARACSAAVG